MTDTDKMQIDNYPKVTFKDSAKVLVVNCLIDSSQEISISINNSEILDKSDILDVQNNEIHLAIDTEISKEDNIVVIYCSL